jgi:hypothetical protein
MRTLLIVALVILAGCSAFPVGFDTDRLQAAVDAADLDGDGRIQGPLELGALVAAVLAALGLWSGGRKIVGLTAPKKIEPKDPVA